MIKLEGTEKQVKWAEDIRKMFLENIEIINPESSKFDLNTANKVRQMMVNERGYEEFKFSQEIIEKKDRNGLIAKINEMYETILERITSEKEAKWFIEKRFEKGWSSICFYLPKKE